MIEQAHRKAVRKKRILIVAVWIAFLIVAGVLLVFYINKSNHDKGIKELQEQTEIVESVFPSVVENDFYSVVSSQSIMRSKLKALAFELENYADIKDAEMLLNDFTALANIEGLVIFDKSGEILYGSTEDEDILGYEVIADIMLTNDI